MEDVNFNVLTAEKFNPMTYVNDQVCPTEKKSEIYCDTKSNYFWVIWVGIPALIILIMYIVLIIYWKKG